MAEKLVYFFGNKEADGRAEQRDALGGKGANLAEMCSIGIPVPPGFTIGTASCIDYLKNPVIGDDLRKQVDEALTRVEKVMGKATPTPRIPC